MDTKNLLTNLNEEYYKLHKTYENLFRTSYMGDHSIDQKLNQAEINLENFKNNKNNLKKINQAIKKEKNKKYKERLNIRKKYFQIYQTPNNIKKLKEEIIQIETELQKKMSLQKTGYINPKTNKFVKASNSEMGLKISTEKDENMRKNCFLGKEKTAGDFVDDYIKLVKMRNQFAKQSGYKNFYEYKAQTEEQMSSKQIFKIFDKLNKKLKPQQKKIKELEKKIPNVLKPRNFNYMMAGDFIHEEDQYFQLENIIKIRGESFSALNINYQGATIKIDLLERDGKYNNGFCHQPCPVFYKNGKRIAGQINFTCNAIPGQIGSGNNAGNTLFHEGGHASHFANMEQEDIILNIEYPPASTARAETQSMFLDTMYSSIERKIRYAKNKKGESYPFSLFEKKVKKLHKLSHQGILSIASVVKFEEIIYNTKEKNLTKDFIIKTAKELSLKYFNYSEPTLRILTVPHIYSRSSSAYYHGYGMAYLALEQRRDYFYKKYGYIVDNKKIGEEMQKVRNLGSKYSFQKLLKITTGKKLSPKSYLKNILKTEEEIISEAKNKIKRLNTIPKFTGEINLNANIEITHGKQIISSNKGNFSNLYKNFNKFIKI